MPFLAGQVPFLLGDCVVPNHLHSVVTQAKHTTFEEPEKLYQNESWEMQPPAQAVTELGWEWGL